jgi:hypothetical protein
MIKVINLARLRKGVMNIEALIIITILDIFHLPVFYLELNYISLYVPHRNTLRLRYELNRLMISISL